MADAWGGAWGSAWGAAWGAGDTPTPTPTIDFEAGDGWARVGRRIFILPPELKPDVAEKRVIKKIKRRVKGKPKAERIVATAQRIVASEIPLMRGARLADSARIEQDFTESDLVAIRTYWKAVEIAALEILDEEELLFLL